MEVTVFGAHGGAGTSTLQALLAPAWDLGCYRPGAPVNLGNELTGPAERPRSRPEPRSGVSARVRAPADSAGRPLVLVSRNTVPAARMACRAAGALHRGGQDVAVIAVVADGAGREPAEATARIELLATSLGAAVVRVPFAAVLRETDSPDAVRLPRPLNRALGELRERLADQRSTDPAAVSSS